jgi:hypothetical protein
MRTNPAVELAAGLDRVLQGDHVGDLLVEAVLVRERATREP